MTRNRAPQDRNQTEPLTPLEAAVEPQTEAEKLREAADGSADNRTVATSMGMPAFVNGEPTGALPAKTRRKLSGELQAMASIDRIMAELDDDDTNLVIYWFVRKFNPRGKTSTEQDV